MKEKVKLQFTIQGEPRTKKNSSRIIKIKLNNGKSYNKVMPSKQFEQYQKDCVWFLPKLSEPICQPVNLSCVYYMGTRRKVDLLNLLNATADILVHYGVLADDNKDIVASVDGSRVLYDKGNPRAEICVEFK